MFRLMPLLTAALVVGAFAAFFVSFLFAPFAVLAVVYAAMILSDRARAAKKRREPAPVTTAGSRTPVPAGHDDNHTTAGG